MSEKTTRLTILIDSPTKQRLEALSEEVDLTISQVIRKLIRDHLQQYESPVKPVVIEKVREDSSTYSGHI
ncbi:hypothetical protein GIR22_20450 [Pseudomonas sp. CCM 7891]|uniref:Ribbon-helix-helix protein RHH domain-containing protein n=1 Tax=Pseudomonas karstica TaxID=1055468 RepID=A0A7X2RUT0_9PSED|nr:hypothetical protein [Pseudomonas karstica]MTD21497.1 hypothetical protein [Pseudomonas karstica]